MCSGSRLTNTHHTQPTQRTLWHTAPQAHVRALRRDAAHTTAARPAASASKVSVPLDACAHQPARGTTTTARGVRRGAPRPAQEKSRRRGGVILTRREMALVRCACYLRAPPDEAGVLAETPVAAASLGQ